MSNKDQKRHPIVMVSLDAVSDGNVDYLLTCPNFSRLARLGLLHRQVDSILVTSTYPVHTCINTGLMPCDHGVFDNTFQDSVKGTEVWRDHKRFIKGKTLPERAYEHGLRTCAMMYPMTAGEKIRYHMTEIPGRSNLAYRVMKSAYYGSAGFMMHCMLKYGKHIIKDGERGMDMLIAKTGADLIRKNKADLYMLHLLDVDTCKHNHGATSKEATEALGRIDECLGHLLAAMESVGMENFEILIFSDHSSLDIKEDLHPNELLTARGFSLQDVHFHTTHGCAFLYISPTASDKLKQDVDDFIKEFLQMDAVSRELSTEEMRLCGATGDGFCRGFSAKPGYELGKYRKGQHGYPMDPEYEDFKIFYLEIGNQASKAAAEAGDAVEDVDGVSQVHGGCIIEVGKKAIDLIESTPKK